MPVWIPTPPLTCQQLGCLGSRAWLPSVNGHDNYPVSNHIIGCDENAGPAEFHSILIARLFEIVKQGRSQAEDEEKAAHVCDGCQ